MSFFTKLRADPHFSRALHSSGKLLSANTISLGLSVLQGIMVARLLAPEGLGLLRVVMVYASTINSVLSFRMSELTVRYGGEYFTKGDKTKAAAVIKAASLLEALVSVLAFLAVVFSAGLAEKYFTEASGVAWMFSWYALGLLASFNLETSTGVLQVTHKIQWQGYFDLAQNIFVTALIGAAFFLHGSLAAVLNAYLFGKIILGLGIFGVAQIQLRKNLGSGWWKTPLTNLSGVKDMLGFAFSSNVSATIIKLFRESELLWVALFLPTDLVGLYSVAYTIVRFIAIPADALIPATFPEINHLAVQKDWRKLKDFLRKVTTLSFVYNLLIGLGFIIFGRWLILIYSGAKFLGAYPALAALTVGLVFNYVLFWNRPLLLSLGLPNYPVWATLIVGLLKTALAFWLIPKYGIVAAGALLSFYYVASVGAMALRGMQEIKRAETKELGIKN